MANLKFTNAINQKVQSCPPIWFMRQAGRYHSHYQNLRSKNSFIELCKDPKLAAEVALGPIEDFDFDAAILFSDILYPLDALGMGLDFAPGPKLDFQLTHDTFHKLKHDSSTIDKLAFQKEAVELTRNLLPNDKSLVGFVGGCWTLFTYAVEGQHKGNLIESKINLDLYNKFSEIMIPLLTQNIQLQLDGGAEVIYIFDTSAGALSPQLFNHIVVPQLKQLAATFPNKIVYYSKDSNSHYYQDDFFTQGKLAGLGFDHHWDISYSLKNYNQQAVQGNFDQTLLFAKPEVFKQHLETYLNSLPKNADDRKGWICGLGHGVLPQTPVENVRTFIKTVREYFNE